MELGRARRTEPGRTTRGSGAIAETAARGAEVAAAAEVKVAGG